MKYYAKQFEDPDGDLWDIAQDVKRLSDLCAAYNLGVSFVDRATWRTVELDFNVQLKAEDGMVEGEYNEQREDSVPKQHNSECEVVRYGGQECWCC